MKTLQSDSAVRIPATAASITHIAVIGLGYVGLPLAIRAAERGLSVVGFDLDASKIAAIADATISFVTPAERRALASLSNFTPTDDPSRLSVDAFIICVPTPVSDAHAPDLKPLESACRTVGRHLRAGNLVVIESTVNPGACETVALPILEKESGLRAGRDFSIAHCPERINPGDAQWNVATIPRVLGGYDAQSTKRAAALYERIVDAPIIQLPSLKEAEAVKMIENAFRDINIAFVNELAMSFDRAGIDLVNVIRAAASKPFAFMPHFPGAGVGGHCIPVDPYYLIRYGETNGFLHTFLLTARSINNRMPAYTVNLLTQTLRRKRKQLSRSTVALLGLAYKRDIGDMRESPALAIRSLLEKRGSVVRTYDPHILEHSTVSSLEEALENADAAIIATDHAAFRSLTPFHFMRSGVDIVIDGRNCLEKNDFAQSGVLYAGIGRGTV